MSDHLPGVHPAAAAAPSVEPAERDPSDRTSKARTASAVLLVIAASAAVAIGTPDVGLLRPRIPLDEGSGRAIRTAGSLAIVLGWVALLVQRRRLQATAAQSADPAPPALRTAAILMGALALLSILSPRVVLDREGTPRGPTPGAATTTTDATPTPPRPSSAGDEAAVEGPPLLPNPPPPPAEQPPPPREDPAREPPTGGGGFDWSALRRAGRALLLILLLVGGGVAAVALGSRLARVRRSPRLPLAPAALAEAEAGLEASLDHVARDGSDPRRQITAAYQRLLGALSASGAPRRPQEAPHEHLARALAPLGVLPEPLHRLSALYVEAQFSERPITERHRAAAAEALEASLAGLRAALASRGAAASGPPPGAGGPERLPLEAGA